MTATRNQSLDTIRGLAILMVLIGHYLHYAPFAVGGLKISDLVVDFGHGGVLLFFMLSGYLIWTTAQRIPAPSFLLRRFSKITPAYWVNVLFVAVAGALIPFFPAFGLRDVVGNLLFLEGRFGIPEMSGVYWTLVIEVQFYLLFAMIFYSPLRPVFWLVPFAAMAANLAAFFLLGRAVTFLTYLPVFFIGAGIAAAERQTIPVRTVALIAAATMLCLALVAPHRGWQAAVFLAVDLGLFAAIYRMGLAETRLAWLGVISYSVYLYHMTLGQPILNALRPENGVVWLALVGVVTGMVLLVSWLSWKHIEVRLVDAGRRLESRFPTAWRAPAKAES